MACTEEEFLELLGGEVYVDMEKLADISKYGICDKVRAEVWKYLLEVAKPDKSEEERFKKQQLLEYQDAKKMETQRLQKKSDTNLNDTELRIVEVSFKHQIQGPKWKM